MVGNHAIRILRPMTGVIQVAESEATSARLFPYTTTNPNSMGSLLGIRFLGRI